MSVNLASFFCSLKIALCFSEAKVQVSLHINKKLINAFVDTHCTVRFSEYLFRLFLLAFCITIEIK